MRKKIFAAVLALAMAFTPVTYSKAEEGNAQIETTVITKGVTYNGSNIEAQNYPTWSKPVTSYLTTTKDGGIMRVQAGDSISGIVAEYYTSDYALTFTKAIPEELPIFGGFYEDENAYYLVTGQNNPDESADVECFRITKYDKDWHRISAVGLYDCNTTRPFRAGSLRMASTGNHLLIRTSHEMYKSEDGYNHQANITIEVDTNSMTITDYFAGVMNSAVGYISHSFNQFIKLEDNKIVSVDHGDAYPRAISMLRYSTDVTTGKFFPDYFSNPCEQIDLLNFPGTPGNNYTGASIGGFELTDTGYIAACNSVNQDENAAKRSTRNVFVSSVAKNGTVTNTWLTDYTEGNGTVSTPQLVKLSGDEFVVLWSVSGKVNYVKVNAAGQKISDTYSMAGSLSDCAPIVVNNKIVWYTWSNADVRFYEIGVNNLGANNVVKTVDESVTLTATGIYVADNTSQIFAGLCTEITKEMPLEYSWYLLNDDGNSWTCLQDWTEGNEWLSWKPATWGDYTIVGKVRIAGMPISETEIYEMISYHPHIKGKCQMPYEGEGGGYLIGFETYDNPGNACTYEMLILDCTLLAEGKDAWIYTTTPCRVDGNALWTIWQPKYGYYWTLFRFYDATGNLVDQECYGFVNAY